MANILRRSLKATWSGLRAGWLIVGITLILVIMSEAGLRLALAVKDQLMDGPLAGHRIDNRPRVDAYRGAEWAQDYFEEYEAAKRLVWEPYVYWRSAPYQGRYVNINQKG